MGQSTRARWNYWLGWALVVAGFAGAAALDPWSLGERDPVALMAGPRAAARFAQAAVLAMGFLQLGLALVLRGTPISAAARRAAECLTGAGAVAYAAGYAARAFWPDGAWLAPAGALLNFAGFLILLRALARGGGAPEFWVVLAVFCFGMLIDAAMGLFAADPGLSQPTYLGPVDGLRQRMLRLAHVAAIALSLLTLLFRDLADRAGPGPLVRRARRALWGGTVGMPLILTAAAFTSVSLKYLLPAPALAVFAGAAAGAWLAQRFAGRLEFWGWLLIAASTGVGLVMGLYAFDGPVPAPEFLRNYNDFARRLTRLAHAYCVVLGLVNILVARLPQRPSVPAWPRRLGVPLLVTGTAVTPLALLLVAGAGLPAAVLGAGPALVAAALVLCLAAA
jgi:hypothetical protein